MDDQSVAQRVLDHIAHGTTDVGREIWREPVANYQSKERLATEIGRILRDAEFVGTTGAAEDRAVVQAIQRGLGSGANDAFTFGKFESAIVHFHRTLTAALS